MDVKRIIKEHGYNISDVASKMGVTRVTLSQTLSRNPTIGTLQRIADVVGCKVGDFFQDEVSIPSPSQEETPQSAPLLCPHCGKPISMHVHIDIE